MTSSTLTRKDKKTPCTNSKLIIRRYAARKFDHDLGKHDPTVAVRDIDFAGLFRTPFITLQSAFFKRILPQINFMIAGPTSVDMYVSSLRRVSDVP